MAEETLYVPFFLDDGTGRMMVDPRGAEMELPPSVEQEYSPSSSVGLTRHFLLRHGLSSADPANLKEYCIREGDHLFVLGTLRENPGLSAVESSANTHSAARPGFLSSDAANVQRRTALEFIYQWQDTVPPRPAEQPLESESFDLNPPAVLMKGASGEPFFISAQSQRDVVETLACRFCTFGAVPS